MLLPKCNKPPCRNIDEKIVSQSGIKVKFAGMPNIIMNQPIIPELLQKKLTSENLIVETKRFFNDKSYQSKMQSAYKNIKNALGRCGASKRAAEIIINEG